VYKRQCCDERTRIRAGRGQLGCAAPSKSGELFGGASEYFGHFLEDCLGGFGGVGSLGDGTAYDQEAGALAKGFGGGGDALLIAGSGSCGADAGDDQYACLLYTSRCV